MKNKTAQEQLIELYEQQIQDLTMMSKIELGDDVIAKIKQLKEMHGGEMNNNPGKTNNTVTTGQNNTGTYPIAGQLWQHYKGGKYTIVAMCNHTETNEVLVVYRSLSFGGYHARPYSQWHDEIWIDGVRKTRFVMVGF